MIDPASILRVLRRHAGQENAIGAAAIAAELGRTRGCAREVRQLIKENRTAWQVQLGTAICMKSGGGYWLATEFDDIDATVEFFKARVVEAQKTFDDVRQSMAQIGFSRFAVVQAIQDGAATSRARNAEKASAAAPELLTWVRGYQRRHGLTAATLARQIGISKGTMSQLLSGKYRGKAPARFVKGALALREEEGA